MQLRLALCLLILAVPTLLQAAGSPAAEARTIVLVRHAERSSTDGDTPLSEAGRMRARALADILRDLKLQAVYVSQMIRTKETADPIARLKSVEPESIPTTEMDRLMDRLSKTPAGSIVLVVHHSGTIPQIVQRLGASTPAIREDEFDRMVVVTIPGEGKPSLLTLRYGKP